MKRNAACWIGLCVAAVAGCGGGGGGNSPPVNTPPPPVVAPAAPAASLAVTLKQLDFSWATVAGATSYRLMGSADGVAPFTQIGADLPASATSVPLEVPVHLLDWLNARYRVQACNSAGCTSSVDLSSTNGYIQATGYFKASNPDAGDSFGIDVAISRDGRTMAVSSYGESSAAQSINGNQDDDSANDAGAVYVFARSASGVWAQQAYIKASNTDAQDGFGISLALSADGNTLVAGARYEDSFATGVNGNALDNTAISAGAAYVFVRTGQTWSQQAYLKASNSEAIDLFGEDVDVSADGNVVAVGARGEDSPANGIDGNQASNLASGAGAVYLFTRSGTTWTQQAYVKASNSGANHQFGYPLALSDDGATLAVAAVVEGSAATGVGGNQSNNGAPDSGAVYVFTFNGTWQQQAYIKASRSIPSLEFGYSLELSGDGNTLAVGSIAEASAATAIDGNQDDSSAPDAGAVYVFSRTAGVWHQQSYLKAANAEAQDRFGIDVALSTNGDILAVGAFTEDSFSSGIYGNPLDNSALSAGAAYVFVRSGTQWMQRTYLKPGVTRADLVFGASVAISGDGNVLGVSLNDSSNATGVGGNPNDAGLIYAGAVQLY